ncbi:MAG: hypothetical protein OER21_16170 [Gemmatimonadota bacterium]|nr:hypothetical protein [Gemmatimonadota bacterium]
MHGVVARGLERPLEVGEEVVATPPPLDPRPARLIDSQMGIGQQQDADGGRHGLGDS